jgi:hypothetical protein
MVGWQLALEEREPMPFYKLWLTDSERNKHTVIVQAADYVAAWDMAAAKVRAEYADQNVWMQVEGWGWTDDPAKIDSPQIRLLTHELM